MSKATQRSSARRAACTAWCHGRCQEHIQTNDQEPISDEAAVSAYAAELLVWLERQADGRE
jgi:hypothetical protein